MLGTVPAVPVVIDLVHLPALSVAHAIQRFDARATANGHARIDCLDVADFREELELHVSVGQRASPEAAGGVARRAERDSVWVAVKVGSRRRSLKLARRTADPLAGRRTLVS
jgi:hypothetical protein